MSTEIVIFARPPVPGRVKTRLASVLGPSAAAQVYRALLDRTITQAYRSGLPVTLAMTEPPAGLSSWSSPDGIRIELQVEGDLGTRMRRAFDSRFAAGADAVILTGSDLPGLTTGHLQAAGAALARVQVVLGPAFDGGYWLVGQRAPGVDLFTQVPWSSPETLAATRARLRALTVVHEELDPLQDLDTAADLDAVLNDGSVDRKLRLALSDAVRGRDGRR